MIICSNHPHLQSWCQISFERHVKGRLFDVTVSDEATWTLEDKCLIRIVLMKTNREAGNCWSSLLEGEYCANAWVQDQMQRKLTLERFQREVSWTRALRAARTA
uniref:CS domain-containing protein n=1 Tax=Fundulus heteroclitus TaxID=8078 RepID=A0A3Q2T5F9_FUNHE